MKNILFFSLMLTLANIAIAAGDQKPNLGIGDEAPGLKVDRWYKGSAVTTFKPGRIYVLEFWATWCGPCKEAMPHLTELAKKYKDNVTVAGISIMEEGEDIPDRIEEFVTDMGDKMDYHVAGDADGYMYRNWLQAAGENSIPASFIVDGQGKVAWIGHPGGLEQPLQQLISGTFDSEAAARERGAEKSAVAAYEAALGKINRAIAGKDFDGAVAAIHSALTTRSELNNMLMMMVMPGLMALDENSAYTELSSLLQNPDYRDAVSQSAMMLVELDTLSRPTYELAIEEINKVLKQYPDNAFGYHMLAMGHARLGGMGRAVQLQEKAILMLNDDPNATDADREDFAAKLVLYKSQATALDTHPVLWNVSSEEVAPLTYRIKCEAIIKEPFHIYPQRSSGGMGMPTKFLFTEDENVEFVGPVEEKGLELKADGTVPYYAGRVTFTQTVKLKSDRKTSLSFAIKSMACNDAICLSPSKQQFTLTLNTQ